MTSNSAFDYAKPFDIMVGYWVNTANIYSSKGVYVLSTKSYVSVYWVERDKILHFRESAEEDFACEVAYVDTRRADKEAIEEALKKTGCATGGALRVLAYDFEVEGASCKGSAGPVSVDGRQTRPDAYQFHVKIQKAGRYHHVYNSHHLPSPDDWHIIGPIVATYPREENEKEGDVGIGVVHNLRRLSYNVPKTSICKLVG
jgi:hypothetical protein